MLAGASWYATNSSRLYPLQPAATGIDDTGQRLPSQILADIRLRYFSAAGDPVRVSELYVQDIVSVVLHAGDQPAATFTGRRKDLRPGQPYPLRPVGSGKSQGAVVFGDLSQTGQWSFASYDQAGLTRRVTANQAMPAEQQRIGRLGTPPAVGPDFLLDGSGDIEVRRELLEIEGEMVNAVVIGLREVDGYQNLVRYAGVCGQRPDTRTCDGNTPIEAIAGIEADCCGRVFIELRGCADIHPISGACGVVITCDTDVDASCPPKYGVPDETGKLPTEFSDPCEPIDQPVSGQGPLGVNL